MVGNKWWMNHFSMLCIQRQYQPTVIRDKKESVYLYVRETSFSFADFLFNVFRGQSLFTQYLNYFATGLQFDVLIYHG